MLVCSHGIYNAGWVARRQPLAGPLSPRGSQPVPTTLRSHFDSPNGPAGPPGGVRGLQYKGFRGCLQGVRQNPRLVTVLTYRDLFASLSFLPEVSRDAKRQA